MIGVNTSSAHIRPSVLPRWLVALCLLGIIGTTLFVRVRLLDLPLERDEGEYAYAGQLMLQGVPPYKFAYSMKFPGTYAAYTLIMAVLGQTTGAIHLGLIMVNSITILLIYFLGQRLFGHVCGIVAAGVFGLLSLSHSVLGLAAHATHFVTLFAVAGTLMLLKAAETRRLSQIFVAGLLFGFAMLMKQNGMSFGVAGGLFILWQEFRTPGTERNRWLQRIAIYCAGAILPLALTCVLLAIGGVFDRFWFWTVLYAREYGELQSIRAGWRALKYIGLPIIAAGPLIWWLAVIGALLVWWRKKNPEALWFIVGFSVAAIATVIPGLHFRHHYFIPLLPAIGLWAGAGSQTVYDTMIRQPRANLWIGILVAAITLAFADTVYRHRLLFFSLSPIDASRAIYDVNPFPESVEIARYIANHTDPSDRIAVIGSEPQIYFYSKRRSATGYIYTYPLMESQPYASTMQREMIKEIEEANPKFLIAVHVGYSWIADSQSTPMVFQGLERYAQQRYKVVGLVTIEPGERATFLWNSQATGVKPSSVAYVNILMRKD